jgi:ATP-dependent DNA ligase
MIPGIFQPTILSRQSPLHSSLFIRPIHPKTEIRPTADAIRKILDAGWQGQLKIHGHRAQIHISADPEENILAYNRQGHLHKKEIPPLLAAELRRLFTPSQQWNVIDAEWIKTEDKIYVFDFLKLDGELLHRLNFASRWKLLPRAYISPAIQTLGILTYLDQCLEALQRPEAWIEGLVFKSPSPGFEDSSIIRCRRK